MTTLRTLDAATHGTIDPDRVFEPQLKWSHCLYQVSHVGQPIRPDPTATEFITPAVRILGFCASQADAERRKAFLQKRGILGPILMCERGSPGIVICRTPERMTPSMQQKRRTQLARAFIDNAILREEMWSQDQLDVLEYKKLTASGADRDTAEAPLKRKIEREERFIQLYNKRPWVQMYRKRFHIDPEIAVRPGAAQIAIKDTRAKHRIHATDTLKLKGDEIDLYVNRMMDLTPEDRAAAQKQKEELLSRLDVPAEVIEENTYEGNAEVPSSCKMQSQTFALISYVLDDSEAMEPMIVVYGHCSEQTYEAAKSTFKRTLSSMIEPFNQCIYPMYEWMCPYDFGWNENDPTAMPNLETSATHKDLNATRAGFREAQKSTRAKVEELLADERRILSSEERMFRMLEITEKDYNDAVNRLGKEEVNNRIFALPSVAKVVAALLRDPDRVVMFSDVFTESLVLTPEDLAEAKAKIFSGALLRPVVDAEGNAGISKAAALLDSILAS
jgi:hypothetical protein